MTTIKARFWITALVLLAAGLVLCAHLTSNTLEFSQYNTNWNGTSSFFASLDRDTTVMIHEARELAPFTNDATLLIIAPSRAPTDDEILAYQTFLDNGNTIIIADDFGQGASILKKTGSAITLPGGQLASIDRQYANPYTIAVYQVRNESPVGSCPSLLLNRPSRVEGGEPLMMTSVLSWIDNDGNRRLNAGETMGQFAVIASERISRGRIVVIADPSLFINAMQVTEGGYANDCLMQNLARPGGPLLVDQMNTRTTDTEGLSRILHVIRTQFIGEVLFFLLLVLVALFAWREKKL